MDYMVERIPGHLVVDPHGGDHGQGQRRKHPKGYGHEAAGQGEHSGDCIEISAEARRRAEEEAAAERAAAGETDSAEGAEDVLAAEEDASQG
jgi:hypothetical protein